MEKKFNYDLFLEDLQRIESTVDCPECESEYIVSTDFASYEFMCGDCGYVFIPKESKYKKEIKLLFNKKGGNNV